LGLRVGCQIRWFGEVWVAVPEWKETAMWTITTRGFYSTVAHRDKPESVLVRGRVREDLDNLADLIPNLEVFEDSTADYRWRAVVTKEAWGNAIRQITAEVDYDNFKNAVAARQGKERAHVYSAVWEDLYTLQVSQ